ncbi:hypothetical protein [Paenibacillus segetis]|uniref:hypothetical protein n=1 Tax=Paenibacillus segetis TaxID=1325360 RepID=UPI0018888340|nr:hypothetical protein [Paenibacillus segetis]
MTIHAKDEGAESDSFHRLSWTRAPGENSRYAGLMTALRQEDISGTLVKEEYYDAAMDIENFRARCRNRHPK